MRPDGRKVDELREVKIIPDYIKHAEGSVLIQMGNTHVLCVATIEKNVPPHIKGTNTGWVTAEYSMLPRATSSRTKRERGSNLGGRTQEIQRLIGRALRSVVNLKKIGEYTITVDCDVLLADGGTRTASITGAFVALAMAVKKLKLMQNINSQIINQFLASVSVGIVDGTPCLDLCYEEDYKADVDMNFVMTERKEFVELQGTGEHSTFSGKDLSCMITLAENGISNLIEMQKNIIKELP